MIFFIVKCRRADFFAGYRESPAGLKKWPDGATGRQWACLCRAGMFCGIFLTFV